MEVDSSELANFVKGIIEGLEQAISGSHHSIVEPVKIELAIVTPKDTSGKFKLFPVEAGGKYQKEEISKITFSVV